MINHLTQRTKPTGQCIHTVRTLREVSVEHFCKKKLVTNYRFEPKTYSKI